MDALALFAIPLVAAISAQETSLAHQRYAAAAQYGQHYVYAVPPGSGWAPGMAIGAGVGALSGHAGPLVAGALVGGAIGHASTMPPVYGALVAYPPGYVHGADFMAPYWGAGFSAGR